MQKTGQRRTSLWLTLCLAVVFAGTARLTASAAPPCAARLVTPGQGIGHVRLGPHGTASLRRLRPADYADVGMSQTRQVWVSPAAPHSTLFLHTVSNGALDIRPLNGLTINEVRVSSAWFRTRRGLHVGSTLAAVRRAFPDARPMSPGSGRRGSTVFYASVRQGIAFEFTHAAPQAHCVGITVYTPGHGPGVGGPVSRADVAEIVRSTRR